MKKYYENKTVLITGASSGIGKYLAILLSTFNTKLVLLGRKEEALKEVEQECIKNGSQAKYFAIDVTDVEAMNSMARDVLAAWGFVDIIVANAGVGGLNPASNFSTSVSRKVMEINFFGMINTIEPFLNLMIEKRKGQIIGVSSMAAFRGLPNAASYCSSKAAQKSFLESFRVDLKRFNIAVGCIHPGFVKTAMTEHDEFDMPFMVPVERSAVLTAKAIARKKPVYLFPWPMKILVMLNRHLPTKLYNFIITKVSKQKDELEPRIF